jgi:hypothetical protein
MMPCTVRSWKNPKSTKPIGEDATVPANYQSDPSSDEDEETPAPSTSKNGTEYSRQRQAQ